MDRLPSSIVDAFFRGRAVLIAGQDIARGDTARLLGNDGSAQGLRAALLRPNPELVQRIEALQAAPPDPAQVEVAQVPWALVLSSAIDTRLTAALEAAAPATRRVRRRFVDYAGPEILTRSPTVLEVMHLALVSKPDSLDGALADTTSWARVARLLQPRVLDRLREAVGPAHLIVIDGVTSRDVLDRDVLTTALEGLDGAQIIFCEGDPAERAWLCDIHPGVQVLDGSLAEFLRRAQLDRPLPVPELLRAEDLAVTVRAPTAAETRVVVFRAQELRDIKRHIEIIGDKPGSYAPHDRLERHDAFRTFIRTPRLRPDYKTFVREFCLERVAYKRLYDAVTERLGVITGTTQPRVASNRPIVLEGFPGAGRTTGLHWLGVRLREDGWLVTQLVSPGDDVDLFATEQIIRLIERRLADAGATVVTVLLADGIGRQGARQLDERLRRAGRRTVVVATGVASTVAPDPEEAEEAQAIARDIYLGYELEASEVQALSSILANVGISASVDNLKRQAGTEGFLGMLDRLDFQAREGVAQVLRHEFDRFVPDLARALCQRPTTMTRGMLGEAIAAAFERAGRSVPGAAGSTAITFTPSMTELTEARDMLRSIFALAWLDKPAPLDLLSRKFPKLFSSYDDMRIVAEKHGFLTETTLDADGSPAFAAINAGVARILRGYAVGGTASVLNELQALADVVPWGTGRAAGGLTGWPRFVYELFRSVGPRGAFRGDFGSTRDLKRLADILGGLRKEKHVQTPQLLVLEAIALRESVDRGSLQTSEQESTLRESRVLLERARDAVSEGPKSQGRDFFLATILASYATTLRRLMEIRIGEHDLSAAEEMAEPALAAAHLSQALQDNWHPFDVAALIYYRLAGAWRQAEAHDRTAQEHYIHAVDRLGIVLDLASELGELPPDQEGRKNDRQREYLIVTDQLQLARSQALAEAREGRLAGLCYLLRRDAIDPATNRIRSAAAATAALRELSQYPVALDEIGSVVLMQRLWVGSRLGGLSLEDGPYVISANADEWDLLRRITQRRLQLGRDEFDSAVGLWLALALLQSGNLPESRRVLQQMSASTGRARRRPFEPVALLSDDAGRARIFRALVRRREERESPLTVYVPDLDWEMQLPRRHLEAGEAVDLVQGDIFQLHVALNYRGLLAVGPRWAQRSVKKPG